MRRSGILSTSTCGIVVVTTVIAVVGFLSVVPVDATVSSGTRTTFVPITPCRLVDTRPAPTTIGPRSVPLGTNDTYVVDALPPAGGCPIPSTASVLQLNVTASDPTANTFLTIWPSNVPRPNASSLNPRAGQGAVPNAVTTAMSPDGRFSVFNESGSVNVIVDIVGYYDDHDFDDRYYPRAQADAATAAAIDAATPSWVQPGTAMSLPAGRCIFVFAYGIGADTDAGKIVSGYIVDAANNRIPSINNATAILPGTVFKTSQGGTIGNIELCNPTGQPKSLPQGWKVIALLNS